MITTLIRNLYDIFDLEKILQSWNKWTTIVIDKGKQDKELLCNKRGKPLTKSICKLFEKVLNKQVSKVLSITEA